MRSAPAAFALAVLLAGCESTQEKSARLATAGAGKAAVGRVERTARNPDVRVEGTTIVAAAGATAVVVELRNTGADAQVRVPVLISLRDAKGAELYRNDLDGLQPALQQVASLRAGQRLAWVHDQVVAARPARSVEAKVGVAAPAGTLPRVELEDVKLDRDASGAFVRGVVRNRSKVVQADMPIFAVVRRGGKIVAAGRAIVEKALPEPQSRPSVFRIFFVGDPRGGDLELHAVPTVPQGAKQ